MKGKINMTKQQKWIALICAGLLLLVLLWPVGGDRKSNTNDDGQNQGQTAGTTENTASESVEAYITYQEKRLKAIVGQIKGAGAVDVMITVKASREIVLDKDTVKSLDTSEETDSTGSSRVTKSQTSQSSTVMSSGQNGQTEPYTIKALEPEIEGVVVAAEGASDPQVAADIVGTVSVLFDVPAHKVRVVEMK